MSVIITACKLSIVVLFMRITNNGASNRQFQYQKVSTEIGGALGINAWGKEKKTGLSRGRSWVMMHLSDGLSQPQRACWSWAGHSQLTLFGVSKRRTLHPHTDQSLDTCSFGRWHGNSCIGLRAVGRANSLFLRGALGGTSLCPFNNIPQGSRRLLCHAWPHLEYQLVIPSLTLYWFGEVINILPFGTDLSIPNRQICRETPNQSLTLRYGHWGMLDLPYRWSHFPLSAGQGLLRVFLPSEWEERPPLCRQLCWVSLTWLCFAPPWTDCSRGAAVIY